MFGGERRGIGDHDKATNSLPRGVFKLFIFDERMRMDLGPGAFLGSTPILVSTRVYPLDPTPQWGSGKAYRGKLRFNDAGQRVGA